jgi:pSer/pThr/pTyr-binding forkhead associated (FHA) protein
MGHEGDDDVAQKTLSIGSFFSGASAQSGTGRAVLSLVESGGGERVFPINRNPTIIGRANNADVVLLDPTVSYFHARIIMHNFGYTVEDMDSAEGTFLRGERVNHARLRHGDMLRLGNTILTFADESATAAENAAQTTALVPDNATEKGLWIRRAASRPGEIRDMGQGARPIAWSPCARRPGSTPSSPRRAPPRRNPRSSSRAPSEHF